MKQPVFKFVALSMICAAFLFSCTNEPSKTSEAAAPALNLDSVKASIAASNKVYGECFAKGDSATFADCYTSDACLNAPNMPRMCGKQAIAAFFNGGYKSGIRNIKLSIEEVMGGKEAIAEIGKYEVLGDKDVSFDKGKYIVIWKEENGKWKMHRDIFNSDMAAMPAK